MVWLFLGVLRRRNLKKGQVDLRAIAQVVKDAAHLHGDKIQAVRFPGILQIGAQEVALFPSLRMKRGEIRTVHAREGELQEGDAPGAVRLRLDRVQDAAGLVR